jgi:carboxyl-terminal processing protease
MTVKFMFGAIVGWLLASSVAYAHESLIGIGIQSAIYHDAFTIIHVLPDSPAAKAGLTPGQVIQEVDGVATEGKSIEECVKLVRGAPGTKVKLTLVDNERDTTNTVELVRVVIQP